jgi:hypothetical protein
MERLMGSDRQRSEEAMRSQSQHSDLLMTTLTTVFQQQQEASRSQAERMREQDAIRLQQDREYFERQRTEAEERRRQEREEYERKRAYELEQQRVEAQRRESDLQSRRDLEKEEARMRLEREKLEMEARREELRQERERMRAESEERRQREKLEFERKMQIEREERERRERADRERWERERAEAERKRDEERREWERREQLRREEMQREADRRREEMVVQTKQMEMNAQRDREHAERMSEQARQERESQREAAERREKMEREAREFQEKERDRQMQLQREEMRLQKERDREHAERMIQLQKVQSSGLGGLTDMLGMEAPELLGKIFGGSDDESSWADAIPKVLGGIGELGKVLAQGAGPGMPSMPPQGRTPRQADGPKRIPIQTPQGVRMITVDQLRELQARQAQAQAVGLQHQPEGPQFNGPLPEHGFTPPEAMAPFDLDDEDEESAEVSTAFQQAERVNTTARAKAAGLDLKTMRNARKALRKLAGKIEKSAEAEWEGLITAALMGEPAILAYINDVTVYAALAETKADPGLVERVIELLRASELVPQGALIYTEADLAAAQSTSDQSNMPVDLPNITEERGVEGVYGKVLPREDTDEEEK